MVAEGVEDEPLVSCSKSHRSLEIFPVSVKIVRPGGGNPNADPPDRSGKQIDSFSAKSRRALRFRALNAFPALSSQFGMTYPGDQWPTDGRECKSHLDRFLKKFRRRWPDAPYLWLFEFQSRGAPHYHLFTSLPVDDETRLELARMWCSIVAPGRSDALAVHEHPKNYIAWEMRGGTYLCKYLEKSSQKCVPDEFLNVGRFWGTSRGIVPRGVPIDEADIPDSVNEQTGEFTEGFQFVVRTLGRLHEKQTRGYSWLRKSSGNYTMPLGASALHQVLEYLNRPPRPDL